MSERIFNIHDVFLIMTAAECVLLALFRLALPASLRIENLIFAVFLATISLSVTGTLIMWNDALFFPTFETIKWFSYFSMCSLIIRGPALYLYVHALTQSQFRLQYSQIIHILPLIGGVLYIGLFSLEPHELRQIVADNQHFDVVSTLWYYVKLVSLAYALAALYSIWKYHQRLKDEYSDYPRSEIGWLSVLVGGFIVNWLWSLTIHCVAKGVGGSAAVFFGTAHNYMMFVLINALFIYSLAYTHRLLRIEKKEHKKTKLDAINLGDIEKVEIGINTHQMHLEGNINIEEFSQRICLSSKTVSSVINRHFGTNFYNFINSHRISAAKNILEDTEKSGLSILEVLLASGFNNKSSFHRFFNRIVGVSPTEYRRRVKDKPRPTS